MIEAIEVVTTFSSKSKADEVGIELVQRHLVACAQVGGPVESIYRWQGTIETRDEYVLTLKTRRELFDAVAAALRKLHSYEVPEILAFPFVTGNEAYLKWIEQETQPKT